MLKGIKNKNFSSDVPYCRMDPSESYYYSLYAWGHKLELGKKIESREIKLRLRWCPPYEESPPLMFITSNPG